MQKVRIVSLDGDKPRVVAALHMIGAIDLRKSKLQLSDDKPAEYFTDISDSLIKVGGALELLSKKEAKKEANKEKHLKANQLLAELKKFKVLNEIYDLDGERKLLVEDQRITSQAERIASAFSTVKIDFSRIKSNYLSYRAFETDKNGAKKLRKRLSKSDNKGIDLNIGDVGKKESLVLLAYEKGKNIDELLVGIRATEIDLSSEYLKGGPASITRAMQKRKADNSRRMQQIGRRFAEISAKDYSRLVSFKEMLEIELDRSEASSSFKKTDSTFVIEGWVQKRQVEELKQRIANVAGTRAYLEEIENDELAPTHTRRPKILQPFDYLVSFYSVQRSDEIDPTWIFIFSFAIFYGLMVTDVGYGIASLLLATLIIRKTNPEGLMCNAAKVWQLSAISAIFFGIISNQYLGFQLNYTTPLQFDWMKNIPELIAITVIFGICQVVIGLALGIINTYNKGHKKMALSKFTSILVVVFGTMAIAGSLFHSFSGTITTISTYIAVASLLLTVVLSGIEATEIVSLITHPLSYARLMGFGLGSVIIAFLIDMAFTPNPNNGIIVFLIYLAVFIILHMLNMILSIFEGLVQGVRLNFVEFFSKFYTGNGVLFKPFSYKRVYTKE